MFNNYIHIRMILLLFRYIFIMCELCVIIATMLGSVYEYENDGL